MESVLRVGSLVLSSRKVYSLTVLDSGFVSSVSCSICHGYENSLLLFDSPFLLVFSL